MRAEKRFKNTIIAAGCAAVIGILAAFFGLRSLEAGSMVIEQVNRELDLLHRLHGRLNALAHDLKEYELNGLKGPKRYGAISRPTGSYWKNRRPGQRNAASSEYLRARLK